MAREADPKFRAPGIDPKQAPRRAPRKAAKKAPAKKAAPRRPKQSPVLDPEAVEVVNIGEVIDPPHEAYLARLKGASWAEAARTAGYPQVSDCKLAVTKWIQLAVREQSADRRAEILMLQRDRYQAFVEAFTPLALEGKDIGAGRLLLQTYAQIDMLERLREPAAEGGKGEHIIIPLDANEQEMVQMLQKAVRRESARTIEGRAEE